MTASITLGDVLISQNPMASSFVLASLTLPGRAQRLNAVALAAGGDAFVGRSVADAGSLAFECHILGDSVEDCADLSDELQAEFGDTEVDGELPVTIGTTTRVYRGRPSTYVPVLDGTNTGSGRCTFALSDPRWFDDLAKSVTVTVASTTGGITTPIDTTGGITSTGSGSTGDANVVNNGTAPAPWVAYISGPVTTPRLMLGGQTVELLGDVLAGSTLVVDSHDGSVRLGVGGASRPWVSFESEWWEIPPGTSTFSFRAAAGTGSTTLIWQDAST